MRLYHLFAQVLVAIAVLVVINVGVQRATVNSMPRQLLRTSAQANPATDLFLGNSLMADDLDEAAFAAARPGSRPLNLGLGSSAPVEHYLIFLQQDRHKGAAVYYGFFDTQLTDSTEADLSALTGNRALAFYTDLDTGLTFYAPNAPYNAAVLRLAATMPMVVERSAIWAKVELVRRRLGERGLPRKRYTRFGRAEDFSLLEPNNVAEFAELCNRVVADRVPLSGPVVAILQRCAEQHVPVYVIEMPMTARHRQRFYTGPAWEGYREHVAGMVKNAGGVFLKASDWVDDDGFADHLHLNADGAKDFSTQLAKWVTRRGGS